MATKYISDAQGEREVELTPEEEAELAAFAVIAAQQKAERDAAIAREESFVADTTRQEFITALKTATPAEIDNFVRTKLNADAVTSLATAQTFCKRTETAFVQVMKVLALLARR